MAAAGAISREAVEYHALGIDEAVDDHERVPRAREGEAAVRADVAEPAGDEDGWHVQILPTAKRNPAVAGFRRGPVLEAEASFAGRERSLRLSFDSRPVAAR